MEYASCDRCGKSFRDCGFCMWCKCGRHWCGKECAKADGYRLNEALINDAFDQPVREWFECDWCNRRSACL